MNGVCLTAVAVGRRDARLRRRPRDARAHDPRPARAGDGVNLEPALRAGEPLGGHFVQGHVDGVARVARSSRRATARASRSSCRTSCCRYCVEKGSIAVDGVCLTIAALDDARVRDRARPAHARPDDARPPRAGRRGQRRGRLLAKYVERLLRGPRPAGLTPLPLARARRDRRSRWRRRRSRRSRRRSRTSASGKFVVVVDAADRENEGDLTIAAQFATPEAINFMATHGRGLICLCLTRGALRRARACRR